MMLIWPKALGRMLECDFSMSKKASTPVGLMKTSQSTGPSPTILENSLRILDCSKGFSSTAWMMNGVHPSFLTSVEVSSPWPTGRVIAMDFFVDKLDIDSSPARLDLFRSPLDKFLSDLLASTVPSRTLPDRSTRSF